MLSLLLLCLAASAVVAFATSAAGAVLLWRLRRMLDGLAPRAQARVHFAVALLPVLVCASVMTAAFAPSFGWIVDHCAGSAHAHDHPHLCLAHPVSTVPAASIFALGGVFTLNLGLRWIRLARASVAAWLTERALIRASRPALEGAFRVLPFPDPQAFVVGVLRPALFVTRGLLSAAYRDHLAPVLSHERAHVRRRDPLRRLVASMALGFHLPKVAEWIERGLARAHEMAADAEAAREVQSPERVAEALIRLTRARGRTLDAVLSFGGTDVEARVAMLLDVEPKPDRPRAAVHDRHLAFVRGRRRQRGRRSPRRRNRARVARRLRDGAVSGTPQPAKNSDCVSEFRAGRADRERLDGCVASGTPH